MAAHRYLRIFWEQTPWSICVTRNSIQMILKVTLKVASQEWELLDIASYTSKKLRVPGCWLLELTTLNCHRSHLDLCKVPWIVSPNLRASCRACTRIELVGMLEMLPWNQERALHHMSANLRFWWDAPRIFNLTDLVQNPWWFNQELVGGLNPSEKY